MIRLYDSFAKKKVDFTPLKAGEIGMYVCGPTVYDFSHVGHARCYVAFDVIVRYLRAQEYRVNYVRNITDVDDKIINRGNELGEDPIKLAARFTEAYDEDMKALGNVKPDVSPKVSDHIAEVVKMIEALVKKGVAYLAGPTPCDVYYSVSAFPTYGGLSGRSLDELQAGARVEVNELKKNPLDFVLWKSAKPGEPSWESPWGPGRPGWHIECSAMSSKYLGDTFDIHGGGMDLIFPHHENEIAQSQGVSGVGTFSRYWLHNGFINVRRAGGGDLEKMSKSLGNFFTIREVLKQHEAETLRYFFLGTHYRSPITFEIAVDESAECPVRFASLEEADTRVDYIYTTIERLGQIVEKSSIEDLSKALPQEFSQAMSDDFNTAVALSCYADALTRANRLLDQANPKDVKLEQAYVDDATKLWNELSAMGKILGLGQEEPAQYFARARQNKCKKNAIDPAFVAQQIEARNAARRAKDFKKSDEIRDQLAAMGVELKDGPGGTEWRVK